jgi:hypothetical protein
MTDVRRYLQGTETTWAFAHTRHRRRAGHQHTHTHTPHPPRPNCAIFASGTHFGAGRPAYTSACLGSMVPEGASVAVGALSTSPRASIIWCARAHACRGEHIGSLAANLHCARRVMHQMPILGKGGGGVGKADKGEGQPSPCFAPAAAAPAPWRRWWSWTWSQAPPAWGRPPGPQAGPPCPPPLAAHMHACGVQAHARAHKACTMCTRTQGTHTGTWKPRCMNAQGSYTGPLGHKGTYVRTWVRWGTDVGKALQTARSPAWPRRRAHVNVNVNELRLGLSNTTRNPEGMRSHNNRKSASQKVC